MSDGDLDRIVREARADERRKILTGRRLPISGRAVDAALEEFWREVVEGAPDAVREGLKARTAPRMRRALEAAEAVRRA